MNAIIKNNKLDNLVDKVIVYSFAMYVFCSKMLDSQWIFFIGDFLQVVLLLTDVILLMVIIYNIFRKRYTIKELLIYVLVGIILFIVYKNGGDINPLLILCYMIVLKNIDKQLFFKSVFVALILSFVVVISSSLIGLIPNHPEMQVRYGVERARWFLGYNWNNTAMNHYLAIILIYICMRDTLRLLDIVVISIINIILFIFTDSKCAFLCIFLAMILYYVFDRYNVVYDKIAKIIIAFPVVSFLAIFFMSLFYDPKNKLLSAVDKIITGRLNLAHEGFGRWHITLWGQMTDMNIEKGTYNFVDISYMNILFNKGLILLIIVLIVFTIYNYVSYKKDEKKILLVIFIVLVHSIIEPHLFQLCNWAMMGLFVNILYEDGIMEVK